MQSRKFTNRHVRPTERTRPRMQVPREVVVIQGEGESSPMNMTSPDKSRRRLSYEYLDDEEGSSSGGEAQQSQELLLPLLPMPPALRSIVTPTNASNSSNVSNASGNRMDMLASAASEWMQPSSVGGQ